LCLCGKNTKTPLLFAAPQVLQYLGHQTKHHAKPMDTNQNPQNKNIVYGNITAGGNVHIGDITYHVEQDFQHSILFLRIEQQASGEYAAQLTLKSRHTGKASLNSTGLPLLNKHISLSIDTDLFEQVNAFQEMRRLDDATFRGLALLTPASVETEQTALSKALFDAFFRGDILEVCRDFVELLEKRKIEELVLAISTDDTDVLNLPFEMVIPHFFPEKLGTQRKSLSVAHFGLVRTMEQDLPKFDMQGKPASAAPLKMLFVTALPENISESAKLLEIEEEQKRLIDAIGTFEATGGAPKIVIEFLDTASLAEISEALRKHHHNILHISGHGSYQKDVKQGVLHLENEDGDHCEVLGKDLGETLRHHQCVKLLILSACETAIAGNGVLEQLSEFGLPSMVAMRFSVTDMGAKIFTTALYKALSGSGTLTQALADARESLWNYLQQQRRQAPDRIHLAEWFTPVVYLNQYTEALVDLKEPYVLPEDFYPRSEFLKTKNTRLIGAGFIGRKRYLNQLRRSFAKGQHIVLHGLGGMGKTTLAEAFAHNYDNHSHEVIIFRKSVELSEKYILDELFARLEADEKVNKNILRQIKQYLESDAAPEEKLQVLIDNYLQNRKTILVFDNFEDVQQGEGGVQERSIGSAGLATFMQHLCRHSPQNCHLLFTTRYVVSNLKASVLHLGLDKMSYAESYRLSNFSATLREIPLAQRQDMFRRFDGHPRAYEFLETILEKDPTTDWSSLAASVGQVEAQVWENLLLEKIYQHLPPAAQHLLQMASVCSTRTPLEALAAMSAQETDALLPLLEALHEWSLCFWDAANRQFEVHRLTREWMLQNILAAEDLKQWAFAAGSFFSGKEGMNVDEGELARAYFELAEAWEAFAAISFRLQSYYRLIGFSQKALELNEAILAKNIDEATNARAYNESGLILRLYGQLDQALERYEQSLMVYRKIGKKEEEGGLLNNIAGIYRGKGDYDTALRYLEQSLAICQQTSDRSGEGTAFNNISQIYDAKGDYDTALQYLQQSLAIRQQIGDRKGESTTIGNIASIYYSKGDYEKAIQYYHDDLAICQQMGDRQGEGTTLNNISQIYGARGDYDTALQYLKQSLAIQQQIGDRQGEGTTLNNIAGIYRARGDYDSTLQYLQQSLAISQQIGDTAGLATTLNNMGVIYWEQKNEVENAIQLLVQSYQIFQQIGSPNVQYPERYLGEIFESIGEARFQEIIAKLQAK